MKMQLGLTLTIAITLLLSRPANALEFNGIEPSTISNLQKNYPKAFDEKANDLWSMDQIIITLFKTGNYQTVELIENGGKYMVNAVAIKRVGNISIAGNSSIATSELFKLVSVSNGSRFILSQFIEIGKKLSELYQTKGFRNARIEVKADKIKNNYVSVQLQVFEGLPSKINDIKIISQNPKLSEKIKQHLKSNIGKNYNDSNKKIILQKTEDYLLENRFLRAKVASTNAALRPNGVDVDVEIKIENPYRYEFIVTGTEETDISELSLIRKVTNSSFAKSSLETVKFIEEFVKEEYLALGYSLVKVNVTEKIDSSEFKKEQILDIQSGQKTTISKIILNGLFTRPEKYYIDFLLSHSSEITKAKLYNSKDIKTGLENLKAELNNQGYLKAKVNFSEERYQTDKSNVHLILNLSEGPLTQLSSVKFVGNTAIDSLTLLKIIGLKKNSPLQLNKLKDAIKKLTDHYRGIGYLEMKLLTPESELVKYSRSNTEASLDFEIEEGPVVRVREIATEGNYTTASKIITRELTFKEDDILTPEKIITSQKRLFQLGIFSEVRIETLERNSNISNRMILVRVREGKPRTIRFGAGITNERNLTARGYIGFRHNNLFGTARVFDTRAEINNNIGDISYLERKFTFSYLERYMIWPQNNLRISATNQTNVDSIEADDVAIKEESRINFRFEYPLTDHLNLFSNLYDLSFQRDFELNTGTTLSEVRIAQLGPTLELDYRDNTFNPKKGSFSALSLRYADPLIGSSDNIQFVKVSAKTTYYWPFFKNWVWANSLRGGYVKNVSNKDNSGVPSDEAFFLGGRSTIRGFEALRERFPSNDELGVENLSQFLIEDASHFGLVKSEIRFPLFSSVGGAIFYDGGYVAIKGFDLDNAYRESVGFGIHIATPVGPVNFEIGFKLDRKAQKVEDPWEFHFSIGSF